MQQKINVSVNEHMAVTDRTNEASERVVRYSRQLSMLVTLFRWSLITQVEYDGIKRDLMRDYGIKSDLTA